MQAQRESSERRTLPATAEWLSRQSTSNSVEADMGNSGDPWLTWVTGKVSKKGSRDTATDEKILTGETVFEGGTPPGRGNSSGKGQKSMLTPCGRVISGTTQLADSKGLQATTMLPCHDAQGICHEALFTSLVY